MKKIIPLPRLLSKTQNVFNCWIRERDKNKGCISCGGSVQHASHFYSVGQYSSLRFSEDNVHGACLRCNYFFHGNLIQYRKNLVIRIGIDRLNLLDSAARNRFRKWDRFTLEQIINIYSKIK